MEEPYLYICQKCKEEYVPKRRGVQKFCSDSCRSGHWQLLHPKDVTPSFEKELITTAIEEKQVKEIKPKKEKKKKKKIELKTNEPTTLADFLTSTAGAFVGSKLERATLREENKPLTKGDMVSLLSNTQRFQKVNNLPPNGYGQQPFFDITTGNIQYVGDKNSFLEN